MNTDITQLKVNLLRIFNHLEEGIILLDHKDIIRWISSPGVEILGTRNVLRLINRHIDELFIEGTAINLIDETLTEIQLPDGNNRYTFIAFKYIPLQAEDQSDWKALIFRDVNLIKDLQEQLRRRGKETKILTKNPKMQHIIELATTVAQSNANVLIEGESGVGKELIANLIHESSSRKDRPFIKINCSAFPETLLESELFGYVKGAFTGAYTDKKGRFEIANGGTIFLDEIGELSLPLQVKLLRVIQERCFERLGSSKTIDVDVRIMAATNRNLKEEVSQGRFRADLYYRLNVVNIHIPPLRERKEDIPLLVMHFLDKYKHYRQVKGVSSKVMNCFMQYSWPGNIRELENAIEHALVCGKKDYITLQDIPDEISGLSKKTDVITTTSIKKVYKRVTTEDCIEAIKNCGGNKTEAARRLGIDKSTLFRKLKTIVT